MGWLSEFAAYLYSLLTSLWDTVIESFVRMITWWLDLINSALAWMVNIVQTIAGWIVDILTALFGALVLVVTDGAVFMIAKVLDFVSIITLSIPVPDFLTSTSLSDLFGSAGPTFGYFFSTMNLTACFSVLGAGYAFRLLRKLFTLGQW